MLQFKVSPQRVRLGQRITFELEFASTAAAAQRLVVDFAVHYVKKSGASAAKVFKWKELTVGARETMVLRRSQVIRDFTTRRHYPGRHAVDLLINGDKRASGWFDLRPA